MEKKLCGQEAGWVKEESLEQQGQKKDPVSV